MDEILPKVLRVLLLAIHKSPLQLCLEISISLNSRNHLRFSTVQILYTLKEKGGKPDIIPYPSPLVYEIHTETSSLRTFKDAEKSQRNCAFMTSASALWGALH